MAWNTLSLIILGPNILFNKDYIFIIGYPVLILVRNSADNIFNNFKTIFGIRETFPYYILILFKF